MTKQKYIAIALFRYFPFGGLQKDMLAVANRLYDKGHQVKIFCRRWESERPEGLEIIEIKCDEHKSNHRKNESFIRKLGVKLKESAPQLFVAFDKIPGADIYYAADTCFKSKVKNERPVYCKSLPRYKHFMSIEKKIFKPGGKTKILALAKPAIDEYIQEYRTEYERFTLLPPGISNDRVNLNKEKLNKIREELKIQNSSEVFIFVGSGFKTKGLDRAIKVIAYMNHTKNCHLVIAGADKKQSFVRLAQKKQIKDKVHFLGGRKDIPELLMSADALIHLARRENTGTVLLEAAVSGLPVLCSKACGYSDYIKKNQLGMVFDIQNENQLKEISEEIIETLADKSLYKSWKENGYAFAKDQNIYSMKEVVVESIESMLNSES